MKITKKGYTRRFIRLFIKKTNMSYYYAKENAEYFAENKDNFELWEVEYDVNECIQDHFR